MPLVSYADVTISVVVSRVTVLDDDYATAVKVAQDKLGPLPPGVRVESIKVERA